MIAVVYYLALCLSIMPNPNRGSCGFQSTEFEQTYERPSRSQMKRESDALQKLGAELIAHSRDRVKSVEMPEDVRDAILACQSIKDHEGRRRQLQFVGKKMRSLSPDEVAVIQQTIEGWHGASKADTAQLHALERRRDKLLTDDSALTTLLADHPELDAQHMRTLIRNARKEQSEHKPPKAYRELFQILKQLQKSDKAAAKARAHAEDDAEDGADLIDDDEHYDGHEA
jgi:ribosome-associated protein